MDNNMLQGEVENTNNTKADVGGFVNQLEAILDEYMVKKAPFALPLGLKEFLATISPYGIIVVAILMLPTLLFALGLSTALAPFGMIGGYGYTWGVFGVITFAVAIASLVLELMAVSGLFKRTKSAWRLLFYVSIIQVIGNLLSLHIVSALIGALINWYILFQMKDMYKN